jgi:hypothetical protein
MPLDLPESQIDLDTGGSTELPFPTPAFWVMNGNAALKQVGGAHYFGGWACSSEKLQAPMDFWESDNMTFPIPGFEETEVDIAQGTLPVYTSRSLLICPMGIRQYSTMEINGYDRRVAPFTPGARPGLQVLGLLGFVSDKTVYPWAPVLLSPKGYQVNHVQKAISTWKAALAPVLKKAGVAASAFPYFWMQIGTFGQERKQEMVGKNKKQPITPITCLVPDDLNASNIERRYVGREIAEWMNDLADQAHEWLHVFDNMQAPKNGAGGGNEYHEPPMPEEPPMEVYDDDDIPF